MTCAIVESGSRRQESKAPHALPAEAVVQLLNTDRDQGLTNARVTEQRSRHGFNELAEAAPVPRWRRFLGQFNELVIWILLVAALLSGWMGEWTDAMAILAIVVLNGILGFFQEEKAEQALAALRRLSAPQAKVIRNGVLQTVPARELVPGDRVELEAGDNIPADVRLLDTIAFVVQEAALTGESLPVEKASACVLSPETALGDRRNMAYLGTVAAAGKASAVVVATGMATELGHIAGLLQRYQPEPTPLQRRLTELGRVLVFVCLAIVAVIFGLQMLRGGQLLDVFLLSVSLAVAAVPEGLPAVVTVALALGLQRMVRRNALIRKLPSVETLGSVTVICSDKTGTLTRNEMTVREIMAGGDFYEVSGSGYTPHGQFKRRQGHGDDGEGLAVEARAEPDLQRALTIAANCNNARVVPRPHDTGRWDVIGDPTEGALVVAALKAGIQETKEPGAKRFEIPFDSERKMMSVVHLAETDRMYSKGAPEMLVARCSSILVAGHIEPLTEARRQDVLRAAGEMASRALRVLALAYRDHPVREDDGFAEEDLVFVGLAGMMDPPREEARQAVEKCRTAGIRPIMITGDHPATALAVARELGIASPNDRVLTGQELDALSDEELASQVERVSVYARVAAEHKLRIVRAWKQRGQVVAMTGDGVNDAPAVKAADIGIAMGIAGTDVTKEASDMVLTDDNFASIVNAIEEGRGIFDNIQKFLHYLLSSNVSEVLFVFFAALVGWPAPLLAVQLLWINLVSDGLPALALGVEPAERDIMRRKPRPPLEPVITWGRGLLMLYHGLLMAAVTALGFALIYQGDEANLPRARTVAFCIIAYAQLFYSFGCRSQQRTLPELGLFSNPQLLGAIVVSGLLQLSVVTLPLAQPVFETTRHPGWEWALVILLALTPVTLIEVSKLVRAGLSTSRSADVPQPGTQRGAS